MVPRYVSAGIVRDSPALGGLSAAIKSAARQNLRGGVPVASNNKMKKASLDHN